MVFIIMIKPETPSKSPKICGISPEQPTGRGVGFQNFRRQGCFRSDSTPSTALTYAYPMHRYAYPNIIIETGIHRLGMFCSHLMIIDNHLIRRRKRIFSRRWRNGGKGFHRPYMLTKCIYHRLNVKIRNFQLVWLSGHIS